MLRFGYVFSHSTTSSISLDGSRSITRLLFLPLGGRNAKVSTNVVCGQSGFTQNIFLFSRIIFVFSHSGKILKAAAVNTMPAGGGHTTVWADWLFTVRSHINIYRITNDFISDIIQMLIQQLNEFFHL